MTKPTGRPRGRPRKDAQPPQTLSQKAAATVTAPASIPSADASADEFLDLVLSQPVRVGRKPLLEADEDTLRLIKELGKLFCTQQEASAALGVAVRTFQNFLANNEAAADAWQDGLQHAKISLRRKQLQLADKNAPMGIFLGKNYLGQKDEHHTTTTVNKAAEELSEGELMEIAKRGAGAASRPTATKH